MYHGWDAVSGPYSFSLRLVLVEIKIHKIAALYWSGWLYLNGASFVCRMPKGVVEKY